MAVSTLSPSRMKMSHRRSVNVNGVCNQLEESTHHVSDNIPEVNIQHTGRDDKCTLKFKTE